MPGGGDRVHDRIIEHVQVQQGRITFSLNDEQRTIGPGEELTVEPGTSHRWWNAGEGEVRVRATMEPTLRFGELILVFWGLCADGHTDAEGKPSPLYGALLATRYREEMRFRQPPQIVQLLPPLAVLARRRGLEQTIERTSTSRPIRARRQGSDGSPSA